jgi:ComF family protein
MKILKEILSVFYPETCFCCNTTISTNNEGICICCRHDLPFTNYTNLKSNKVEKSFYGRIPIEEATSLLYFSKKGPIQELMHHLKYRNKEKIGQILGVWMAQDLKQSNRFKNIDAIVPVPLHKKRLKERGYNQLTLFGKTLSKELNIPYLPDNLIRIASTKTQTRKFRVERWSNVSTTFYVKDPVVFENKHVLLIDDIVTTGATVEACFHAFEKVKLFKMSLATMSYTN